MLSAALRACGCRRRVRSPTVLWRLLHASEPPRRLAWGDLVQSSTVEEVAAALLAGGREVLRKVASWNVRWL
eukprot:15011889-Alexandrium_andersonii.AAC.1